MVRIDLSLVRFLAVGLLVTLIDLGLTYLIDRLTGQRALAVTTGFAAGLAAGYLLHARISFAAPLAPTRQIPRLLVTVGINYLLTLGIVEACARLFGWPTLSGKLISLPMVAVLSYLLSRYWVYNDGPVSAPSYQRHNEALLSTTTPTPAQISDFPKALELAVITVTFHPDIERFEKLLAAIPETAWLVVVDNDSIPERYHQLQNLLNHRSKTHLLRNSVNEGLAKALNQGANYTWKHIESARYLIFMDQDSVPFQGAIERLLTIHADLERCGHPVGCVGPRLIDSGTGLQHGFHCIEGWRWVRFYPGEEDRRPVLCSNLNGSGTLLKADFFRELGGLDETLFIDHVDTEWAFRVLASGYQLFGIPEARFEHSMGERSLRFWCFGWRIWPQRSPKRHYYLFRNAIWLMRRNYVPTVWKNWALAKLLLTMWAHLIFDHRRSQQLREMHAGILAGINSQSQR